MTISLIKENQKYTFEELMNKVYSSYVTCAVSESDILLFYPSKNEKSLVAQLYDKTYAKRAYTFVIRFTHFMEDFQKMREYVNQLEPFEIVEHGTVTIKF